MDDGREPRATVLDRLVVLIASRRTAGVLRVAIDGPDAAGKTTLADELAAGLVGVCDTVRAGVDGFHQPRHVRYRRGGLSPEGVYHDSFDYAAVRSALLDPLGPGGDRRYRTAVFDHRTDEPVDPPVERAPDGAVLLFDGVFLLRPELRDHWDVSVYLHVGDDEVVRRAVRRDADLMGGPDAVVERYTRRYLPAQRLYRADAAPRSHADVVLDAEDPHHLRVLAWPT